MEIKGALITYSLSRDENGGEYSSSLFSGSGILFNRRWVLAHGSLLSPLKATARILEAQKSPFVKNKLYHTLPTVYVSYEQKQNSSAPKLHSASVVQDSDNSYESLIKETADGNSRDEVFLNNIVVSRGKISMVWKCKLLSEVVDTILSSWTIGHDAKDIDKQREVGKEYLPVFVLIDIGDGNVKSEEQKAALLHLFEHGLDGEKPGREVQRGDEVLLEGTPFGNEVFLNSLSAGVVCNVVGPQQTLLLCDAPSTLCCEGGPLFFKHSGDLVGMVVSSLSWWRSEWVGLTMAARLTPILHTLLYPEQPLSSCLNTIISAQPKDLPILPLLETVDSCVVLVRCGEGWGSGVAVGSGYFITCSHVVENHKRHDPSIFFLGKTVKCNVIFRTHNNMAYDLALLYSGECKLSKSIEFATTPPIKGETVITVGYPYFNEKMISNLKPTVTKGLVNNVTPYMVQTSCCVQSGSSGGALLRVLHKDGNFTCHLLGIIVCNAKNEETNATFPHLNMAVPISAFDKTLKKYLKDPRITTLKNFEENNPNIQSLWKFQLCKNKL